MHIAPFVFRAAPSSKDFLVDTHCNFRIIRIPRPGPSIWKLYNIGDDPLLDRIVAAIWNLAAQL